MTLVLGMRASCPVLALVGGEVDSLEGLEGSEGLLTSSTASTLLARAMHFHCPPTMMDTTGDDCIRTTSSFCLSYPGLRRTSLYHLRICCKLIATVTSLGRYS